MPGPSCLESKWGSRTLRTGRFWMTVGPLWWEPRWGAVCHLTLFERRAGVKLTAAAGCDRAAAILERLWRGRPLHTRPGATEQQRPIDPQVGAPLYRGRFKEKERDLYFKYQHVYSFSTSQSVLRSGGEVSRRLLPPSQRGQRRDGELSPRRRGQQEADGGGRAAGEQRRERLQRPAQRHLHPQPALQQPRGQGAASPSSERPRRCTGPWPATDFCLFFAAGRLWYQNRLFRWRQAKDGEDLQRQRSVHEGQKSGEAPGIVSVKNKPVILNFKMFEKSPLTKGLLCCVDARRCQIQTVDLQMLRFFFFLNLRSAERVECQRWKADGESVAHD